MKGTQQQVLEDVAKKSPALRTAGAAAKTVGRVTQVGSVAAMALEDSPAVTGQPVSTLLDPHLPDQVSSESRYFTELFKYWVGLRDTEPKLPAHMRYQPNPPAE